MIGEGLRFKEIRNTVIRFINIIIRELYAFLNFKH